MSPQSARNKQFYWQIIIAPCAIAAALLLGRVGAIARLPVLAVVIAFFVTMGVAFVRGTEGLYLIIFAMLFSPEISSGIATGRTGGEGAGRVVLRLEDVIMFAVVLGWILRSAYHGRRFAILKTPINASIWIYVAASIVATLLGVLRGSVGAFWAGFFHNLRYFEYFLLFFMILAHVREKTEIKRMIWAMFIVFGLAMLYGYAQIGTGVRVSAPFDAEPNTFGGYIVLLTCLAAGIALVDTRARIRFTMVGLILLALPPLMFTLSRASYLALIAGFFAFLAVSHHRVLIGAVAVAFVAAMMLGMPLFPEKVQERVAGTFEAERQYHVQIAGVDFDASSSARIISYQQAVKKWMGSPVIGYGVTGSHFIDGQYPRLLVETGVVGLAAFLIIFLRLLREVRIVYRGASDPTLKGAAMGFFCGTLALLAHGTAANSFIIVRIAEPFWLLAALILLIPSAEEEGEQNATSEASPA